VLDIVNEIHLNLRQHFRFSISELEMFQTEIFTPAKGQGMGLALLKFNMKKLMVLTISLLMISQISYAEVDYNQQDKQKHIQASAGISMISYGSLRSAKFGRVSSSLLALSLTMLVGHMKESSDPIYDREDMQANALGATAGIMIPMSFTF
jgi:hypothetical protein